MGIRDDWRFISREGPDSDAWINDTTAPQFTVPDREIWNILSVWVEFTATATAGTRQLRLVVQDDTNDVMFEVVPGATLTASQVRQFAFFPGAPDLTTFRDTDLLTTPLPVGLILRPGWDLGIFTTAGDSVDDSDATSDLDLMVVQLMYAKQSVISTDGGTPQSSDN